MIAVNKYVNRQHLLQYSLDEQLIHGMRVSNLAYQVAKELGEPEEFCHYRSRYVGSAPTQYVVRFRSSPLP